ncbi:MAG: 5-(carboxyamino)imidazole ribonucleotide mutase [SAR202 cluster bacterium]|nr:5-(carboxyamino)imidazole ribonucleotide mutase [SAR202 cluster bacterium]
MPLVGIVIGSKSDQSVVDATSEVLNDLGVDHEVVVASAHRTPEKVKEYGESARSRGVEVIIAAAGGSAGLPGVMASWTTLPVIGIPVPSSDMNGLDSLYAIAQMPPGIPVACVAIGSWGARNAAYLAAQILGNNHDEIRSAYDDYRQGLKSR